MGTRFRKLIRILRVRGVRYAFHFCWYYMLLKVTDRWKSLQWLFFALAPYPQHLEIEVTTRCNLRCRMCEHTYWDEPGRDLSFEQFEGILEQFPNLRWLGLTGIGESFLNPDYLKMLALAKSRLITLEISDPFHSIQKEEVEALVAMGVDRLFISCDGATQATYEGLRRGARFEVVKENLHTLFSERGRTRALIPEIFFHYVICTENSGEVLDFIRWVDGLRQGQPVTVQFSRVLHPFPQIQDLYVEVDPGLMDRATALAGQLGVGLIWNRDVPKEKPALGECLAWIEPFIFVTGDVVPCCAGNEANRREYQRAHRLGNIFEEPFPKIWRGEGYRLLRRCIRAGKVPGPCVYCPIYDVRTQA